MPSRREQAYHELLVLCLRRGDPDAAPELLAVFERPLLYYLRRRPRA